jgi:hypothetical protein
MPSDLWAYGPQEQENGEEGKYYKIVVRSANARSMAIHADLLPIFAIRTSPDL